MAKDESIALNSDDPVPSYFEFEVMKEGYIVMELRSKKTKVKQKILLFASKIYRFFSYPDLLFPPMTIGNQVS